jgi:phospholipid/cholesterol/gamma-HCH transport system permease protein
MASITTGLASSGARETRNPLLAFLEWFGELGIFCVRLAKATFTPPFEWRELVRQMDIVGALSFPLVAAAGAATGAVMSLQMRFGLVRFGAKGMLPTVIVLSLIRETAPVITSLVVSGRVGAGIGAELGSMKVSEQIDAMEASAVNPYKFLVATRVLACIMMLPLLTLAADFCGVIAGWLASSLQDPISLRLFINHGLQMADFGDFLPPTIKTAVFGFIIGTIGCFQGMRTRGGTEGVGRSATSSVVIASLLIILADVLLVRFILVFFP